MRRHLVAGLLLALSSPMALAQIGQPVNPYPIPRVVDNQSTTVAVTNTFQKIWSANANRLGCTFQNNGTHTMWVFFGATASATAATSAVIAPGQAVYCQSGSLTYQGEIAVTGTMGDAFYAAAQ